MNRVLSLLSDQVFDLLVVGGGILGAGVARDAALRGLRVALIDKSDFASGTSSRSSKLIHGGFRYLEQFNFRLVAEACREREILRRIAPHLVKPQAFLFPVYDGDPRPLTKIRLGMALYDLISMYRNIAPHQHLRAEQTLKKEPSLSRGGLRGAVLFHDCKEDDARFCLDNILHAAQCGALCANYCELREFISSNGRLAAARVTDRLSSQSFEIRARAFVNAAGPWVDRVAALARQCGDTVVLSPTKGVHLLLPRLTKEYAIAFQARADGRVLFVIPWGDCSLVGTTDTDFQGNTDSVRAERADVDYLLREIRRLFPEKSIAESDIITTFAGVRSLVDSEARNPSARSREHRIIRQGRNFLSIAGGKYTTYRAIAEEAVDIACEMLDIRGAYCSTAETPLPEHRPLPPGDRIADSPTVYSSDIIHACEHEMAVTVNDVMRRRTQLALSRNGSAEVAERVAKIMAPILGWDQQQMRAQVEEYAAEWKCNRP